MHEVIRSAEVILDWATRKVLELVENWPCVFSCHYPEKVFSPRCSSDPRVIFASVIPLAHLAISHPAVTVQEVMT